MGNFPSDLRYAFRMMRAYPAFIAIAVTVHTSVSARRPLLHVFRPDSDELPSRCQRLFVLSGKKCDDQYMRESIEIETIASTITSSAT